MSIFIDSAILCDAVRREDNGKLIAIGVYSVDVGISIMPVSLSFTLLARVKAVRNGKSSVHVRMLLNKEVVSWVTGDLDENLPEYATWVPIPLPPFQVNSKGMLRAEFKSEEQDWIEFFCTEIKLTEFPEALRQYRK